MQLYRRACSKLPAFLLLEACMHGDVDGKRTRELCQGPHFSPAMIHTQCSAHGYPPPPPPTTTLPWPTSTQHYPTTTQCNLGSSMSSSVCMSYNFLYLALFRVSHGSSHACMERGSCDESSQNVHWTQGIHPRAYCMIIFVTTGVYILHKRPWVLNPS